MIPSAFTDVSPDGQTLYLGAVGFPEAPAGREVRAIALDAAQIAAEACQRAGRNLTRSEWERYLPAGSPYDRTCQEWPEPVVT